MKQTTLFGTATSTTPTQTNAINGNKNIKKTHQSPKMALSDYFKSSNQMNSKSNTEEQISEVNILQPSQCNLKFASSLSTSEVKNSPVSKIAEEISIISIESPMAKPITNTTPLNRNNLEMSNSQENKTKKRNVTKSCNSDGNQITSHFFPKKLSDLDAFRSSFEEDEKSLKKTKQKDQIKQIFVEGNILNFEDASFVFMLSEFFYDFHEIFGIQPNDDWSPPELTDFCKALQSCDPIENFPILAPLLVRFISFLSAEILDYLNEKIDVLNTVYNASALLWFYFHKNNNKEVLEILQTDFYCLPSDQKIFIFNVLLEGVISESSFRPFYDEKLTHIEEVKKKLRCLRADLFKFNRELSSLKLYKTEKTPNSNELLDSNDKENVNFNSNCQTNEEDIDTRMQKVSHRINNIQKEIDKVQNNLHGIDSIAISNKKLGTDSYGRNYYVLKSYSETAVLVELDKIKTDFFAQLEPERKSTTKQTQNTKTGKQNKNKRINSQKSPTTESQNNEDTTKVDGKILTQQSPTIIEDYIESNSIVWMEYSTESQLKDLLNFLKTDGCGMKFSTRIEERITCINDAPSHYLRSMKRDKASSVEYTCKEFTTQLIDLGEDLLSSGLVSTRFDYITWIDTLSNGVYGYTHESCIELTHKLTYLIDSLVDSCRSNINHIPIQNSYLPPTAPTLSRLFLLLDYYERNIDTVNSCYRKSCKICHRKKIWDGSNYNPLFICKDCFRPFHLTCQDPPLKDIAFNHTCNECATPQASTANSFYRTSILSDSEVESSSDTEEPIQTRRLRPRTRYTANNSSQRSYPKFEKKRRIISSESEGDSPNMQRMELRSMMYQPPKKKLSQPQIGYASKLRSACT